MRAIVDNELSVNINDRQLFLLFSVPPSSPTIDGGSNVKVVVDEPFNLTCHAKNARPAANITW